MNYKRAKRKFINKRLCDFGIYFGRLGYITISREEFTYSGLSLYPEREQFYNQLKNKSSFVNQFLFAERVCRKFGWNFTYTKKINF